VRTGLRYLDGSEVWLTMPRILTDFGMAFLAKYERAGDPEDLEQAITVLEHALSVSTERSSELEAVLGRALLSRYQLGLQSEDADRAVSYLRLAVEGGEERASALTVQLNALGTALLHRHLATGDPADLEEAITTFRMVLNRLREYDPLNLMPERHPGPHPLLPPSQVSLGLALRRRYEQTGDPGDASESAEWLQKSLALLPSGHPLREALAAAEDARQGGTSSTAEEP
jgi:tetratricopeptide (TPR) repeat protein